MTSMRVIKVRMYLRMLRQDLACKLFGHKVVQHTAYTGPGDPMGAWSECIRCGDVVGDV